MRVARRGYGVFAVSIAMLPVLAKSSRYRHTISHDLPSGASEKQDRDWREYRALADPADLGFRF
jgi:hypothetical protein